MLLQDATLTQVGAVVRSLSPAPPWVDGAEPAPLRVCLTAPELTEQPRGSRVFLRVRPEDATWLNLHRPRVADAELRLILWVDDVAMHALVSRAVDFVDWVSRIVAVPPAVVPNFAVENLRAALEADAPIVWSGPGLEDCLAVLGHDSRVWLRRDTPYPEMLERLREPGVVVVDGIEIEHDAWRVRAALAENGRGVGWIARDPVCAVAGAWQLGAQLEDWDLARTKLADAGWEHAGLAAAWFDLDRSRIDAACGQIGELRASRYAVRDIAIASAPVWALRERVGGDDVRAALDELRDGSLPEDAGGRVRWSERGRGEVGELGETGVEFMRPVLVAGLRDLARRGPVACPDAALVDVALRARLGDIGTQLELRRWEAKAVRSPERLIEWLTDRGQGRKALAIARVWTKATERRSVSGRAKARAIERARARASLVRVARLFEEPESDGALLARSFGELQQLRARWPNDRYIAYAMLCCHIEDGMRTKAARDLLNQLGGLTPPNADLEMQIVRAQHAVLRAVNERSAAVGAEKLIRGVQRSIGALFDRSPRFDDIVRLRVLIMMVSAAHCIILGHAGAASRDFSDALECTGELLVHDPSYFAVGCLEAVCRINLGRMSDAIGQPRDAQRQVSAACAILRRLNEIEMGRRDVESILQTCLNDSARVMRELGDVDASRLLLREAIARANDWRKRAVRDPSPAVESLAEQYRELGSTELAAGDRETANHYFEYALALHGESAGRGFALNDIELRERARIYAHMAAVEPSRAIYWLNRSTRTWRELLAQDSGNLITSQFLAVSLINSAKLLLNQNHTDQARAQLREAHALFESARQQGQLANLFRASAHEVAELMARLDTEAE